MCGRYVLAEDPTELITEFGAVFDHGNSQEPPFFTPNFNVAPTSIVPVVVGGEAADGAVTRDFTFVRWGVVPRWAGSKSTLLVNARGETVAEKATFAKAFSRSRCLIPASGYYEWKRPEKDPYFIRHVDHTPLAMAGIIMESEVDGVLQPSCAIITLGAAPNIELIHDRMPATIPRAFWNDWLDPSVGPVDSLMMMQAETDLCALPVSRRVNSIRNNDSSLLNPVG